MTRHDRRLHAIRPDLADARLAGEVEAARFVAGRPARVTVPHVALRDAPDPHSGQASELLMGDAVTVFDQADGWAWIQAARDGYVGYVATAALGPKTRQPTHLVAVPRTFIYPAADMKLPHRDCLPLGAAIAVTGTELVRGTSYALLESGGAIISGQLRSVEDAPANDFVAVAELLLHTPYLWGGTTPFGIDCSGLVQLSMRMAGLDVLRDTDMQAATIGHALEPGRDISNQGAALSISGLRRGDLVFWKGHVAIMTDAETVIHANGHTMMVSRERLADAIERIGYLYGGPTGFRRP